MAVIAALAAVSNVVANLMLIPRLGIVGAAVSTLISESVLLVGPVILYAKASGMPSFLKRMAWISSAAVFAWLLGQGLFSGAPTPGAITTLIAYGLLTGPVLWSLRRAESTVA